MEISVVVTTLNEEKTIGKLLDSLLVQTKKPSEIVIVDGGSEDNTVNIIRVYKKKHTSIRLFEETGSIAHGRNVSIRKARFPIIAQIDAGCWAKADWLEKITAPLAGTKGEFVAGFYHMVGDVPMQKAAAAFLGIAPNRFNPNTFLPSARSMAFRKNVWEKIGGFSEKLELGGEDTLFNYEIIKRNIPIIRVKDAIVYWEMPKTMREVVKKFYYYAKGDAQAGIWWHPTQKNATHNLKILSIFVRYAIGFMVLLLALKISWVVVFLVLGFVAYLGWSIFKMRDVVIDNSARLWLPWLQVWSDFAVMAGFAAGMLKRKI